MNRQVIQICIEEVNRFLGLTMTYDDVCQRGRPYEIAFTRAVISYVMRESIHIGYREIGAMIGGRDHATVHHACKKVRESFGPERKKYFSVINVCLSRVNAIKQERQDIIDAREAAFQGDKERMNALIDKIKEREGKRFELLVSALRSDFGEGSGQQGYIWKKIEARVDALR